MSTVKANAAQIGQSATPTNNFTLYQPAVPDGTVRLGNGNAGSVTDVVTVNSSGNVGIGTNTPGTKLEVKGTGFVAASVSGDSTSETQLRFNTNTAARISNQANTALLFDTNATERMRIDASGNVGIGTSSPTTKLQINSQDGFRFDVAAGAKSYMRFGSANTGEGTAELSYTRATGVIAVSYGTTGSSLTDRLVIDLNGNVGVGTTSPTGSGAGYTTLHINNATSGGQLHLTGGGSGAAATDGSLFTQANTELFINNQEAGPINFYVNGSERARITSGGDLAIGKTSASESYTSGNGFGFAAAGIDPFFSVVNVAANGVNACAYFNKRNTQASNPLVIFVSNNGSSQVTVGSITHNGTNTTYGTSSDYRLKENVQPMTGALSKVAQLKPCTWSWKANGSAGQGFIAHELQDVIADAVAGSKDAVDKKGEPVYQTVDTSFLVATLTAAIQELKAEVDSLKAQLKGA